MLPGVRDLEFMGEHGWGIGVVNYILDTNYTGLNMTAGTYDTFGRYLFAGITAKY